MIDYEEENVFWVLSQLEGNVWVRSAVYATFPALLALAFVLLEEHFHEQFDEVGFLNWDKSHVWSGTMAVLSLLVAFRTQQGFSRFWEGTGLLHQMKGEWFDTVSNVVAFTTSPKAKREKEVLDFRGVIIRLMSLVHASALEEISATNAQLPTIDVYGLDLSTLKFVKECTEVYHFNKVEALLHILQTAITMAHENGIISVPAPIVSRVYQTISRGYVNLLNTKKITDTKFPFPYVQIIALLMLFQSVLTPLIFATTFHHILWSPVCAFVPMFGLHALNFIAIELENPFGIDANDLPLVGFQQEMNNCLLMLLHPNSDIMPTLSGKALSDYEEMHSRTMSGEVEHKLCRFNTTKLEEAEGKKILSRSTSRLGDVRSRAIAFFSASKSSSRTGELNHMQEDREMSSEQVTYDVQDFDMEVLPSFRDVHARSHDAGAEIPEENPAATPLGTEPPKGMPERTEFGTAHVSPNLLPGCASVSTRTSLATQPGDLEELAGDIEQLRRTIRQWTAAMESQVQDMGRNLTAVNEQMSALADRGPARRRSSLRNSRGSPGFHQSEEDVSIMTPFSNLTPSCSEDRPSPSSQDVVLRPGPVMASMRLQSARAIAEKAGDPATGTRI